ncbi:MAG: hypothetical protein AAGC46_08800 [Solirubrobacteraceae bacterium]|nr:hypothetical protein [Patulibacter sp.]
MDHFTSTENARPWWEDVAHLRGDDAPTPRRAPALATSSHDLLLTDAPVRDEYATSRSSDDLSLDEYTSRRSRIGEEPRDRSRAARRAPSGRRADRARSDWFTQEASTAGRRTKPRVDPTRPARPRATLVDLSPDHAFMRRAQQVRRRPGERPTVTITGRPDAALPPQVREPERRKARRTREQASALISSPDRLILWAVALGLLMILASIGTAQADAATPLTLLR